MVNSSREPAPVVGAYTAFVNGNCKSGSQWRKDRVQGELALAQPLFGAELLQFRRGDFPIIQLSAGTVPFNRVGKAVQIFVFDLVVPPPAMMISGSLHACVRGEKFQSTTRFVQSRDAAPAHCRVRSELESASALTWSASEGRVDNPSRFLFRKARIMKCQNPLR